MLIMPYITLTKAAREVLYLAALHEKCRQYVQGQYYQLNFMQYSNICSVVQWL